MLVAFSAATCVLHQCYEMGLCWGGGLKKGRYLRSIVFFGGVGGGVGCAFSPLVAKSEKWTFGVYASLTNSYSELQPYVQN